MKDKFVFYIHSDIFELENFENQNFKDFYDKIKPIIKVAEQLKADIYYSTSHIQGLNECIKDFNQNFNFSQGNKLEVLLENAIINSSNNYIFKINFLEEQSKINYFNIQSVHIENLNKKVIFISSTKSDKEILLAINSNEEFFKFELNYFSTVSTLWDFINSTQSRIFSENPKHGTKEKIAFKSNKGNSVSQLKCTINEAQILLNSAIVDFKKSENLFNFDEKTNTFIEFFDENTLNKFHGFHIENSDLIRVPNSIRTYFNK